MSRSGYVEDYDCEYPEWAMIRWRGAVASATKGKRGQALVREAIAALDAMPEKKLIANDLERADGCVCTLGAVGKARGLDMTGLNPEDIWTVADKFGVARALAAEIVYLNDESGPWKETPEARWARMRRHLESMIVADPAGEAAA